MTQHSKRRSKSSDGRNIPHPPINFNASPHQDNSAFEGKEETSGSKGRGKNWSDAETRFLLEIWRENYPISKRRNSGVWDSIATQLNKALLDQGLNSFRTGTHKAFGRRLQTGEGPQWSFR